MSYSEVEVSAATATMEKYRGDQTGEAGAALVVVGLSAAPFRESEFRDDMIRVAHRAGVSIRQLADVSGLGRKAVTAIVASNANVQD